MVVNSPVSMAMRFGVLRMGEICERSERATENEKKRFGGNFKFSGCGSLTKAPTLLSPILSLYYRADTDNTIFGFQLLFLSGWCGVFHIQCPTYYLCYLTKIVSNIYSTLVSFIFNNVLDWICKKVGILWLGLRQISLDTYLTICFLLYIS